MTLRLRRHPDRHRRAPGQGCSLPGRKTWPVRGRTIRRHGKQDPGRGAAQRTQEALNAQTGKLSDQPQDLVQITWTNPKNYHRGRIFKVPTHLVGGTPTRHHRQGIHYVQHARWRRKPLFPVSVARGLQQAAYDAVAGPWGPNPRTSTGMGAETDRVCEASPRAGAGRLTGPFPGGTRCLRCSELGSQRCAEAVCKRRCHFSCKQCRECVGKQRSE